MKKIGFRVLAKFLTIYIQKRNKIEPKNEKKLYQRKMTN